MTRSTLSLAGRYASAIPANVHLERCWPEASKLTPQRKLILDIGQDTKEYGFCADFNHVVMSGLCEQCRRKTG